MSEVQNRNAFCQDESGFPFCAGAAKSRLGSGPAHRGLQTETKDAIHKSKFTAAATGWDRFPSHMAGDTIRILASLSWKCTRIFTWAYVGLAERQRNGRCSPLEADT